MTRWLAVLGFTAAFIHRALADSESFNLYGAHLNHYTSIRREGEFSKDVSPPALLAAVKQSPKEYHGFAIYDRTALCQLDGQRAWFAIITQLKGKNAVVFAYTADSGQNWRQTVAPISADSVKMSFLDDKNGFLLALGSPAAGLMDQNLYGTTDGGEHWQLLKASPVHGCYPNGVAFRNLTDGWISAAHHGGDAAPLYRSRDGGKSWQLQAFAVPADYQGGYVDTYIPLFFGPENMKGILPVKLVRHDPKPDHEARVNYDSDDGGAT